MRRRSRLERAKRLTAAEPGRCAGHSQRQVAGTMIKASAVPEVKVTHPQAKITHEAAIGSVDSRQLETLMARGLDPEQAVDLIIRGLLS